jgi:hypothetical protein
MQFELRYWDSPYDLVAESNTLDDVLAAIGNSSDPNDLINYNVIDTVGERTVRLWEEAGEEFYVQQTLPEAGAQFEFETGEPEARLNAAKQKVRVLINVS